MHLGKNIEGVSVDKYIEMLKETHLDSETIKDGFIQGRYIQHGEEYPFKGTVYIDGKPTDDIRNIVGEITDLDNPMSPLKHAFLGDITHNKNNTIMKFVKIPPGLYVPIHYLLVKPRKEYPNIGKRIIGNKISGEYRGEWSFKEGAFDLTVFNAIGKIEAETEIKNTTHLELNISPELDTETRKQMIRELRC